MSPKKPASAPSGWHFRLLLKYLLEVFFKIHLILAFLAMLFVGLVLLL